MPEIRIEVKGLDRLERALGGDFVDDLLRPGFEKAAVIVESSWKSKAHVVTRKYLDSLGSHLRGRGADIEAHIGPQPGLGQPRPYSEAQTARWRKPRKGINRGDPQEYALHEDQGTRYRAGHPAAEPALNDNVEKIVSVVTQEADKALTRRL